jgi:hypothetical protein
MMFSHHSGQTPATPPDTPQTSTATSQPETTPATPVTPTPPADKSAAKQSVSPQAAPASGSAATGASSATQTAAVQNPPRLAPLGFDPKTLDSKKNSKLKIDLSHFPPGLSFTVEMDGKLYYKGPAGSKSDYDNMLVPPGEHQFRVTVSGGTVQKTSNAATGQFVAKKRMALKVELKRKANGITVSSPVLDTGTQVAATLKEDHFFF